MSDPTAPPSQSLVAGKYQLSTLIGRGGMGSVWEGRHVSLGTRVAVKFIEKEYADSPEARNRFHTEARAAATIQSKYAVQIYDHGVTEDGRPYIVMELLEGEGLDKRVERLGRMPLQDVARMMLQVCRALQRAHDGGIIHRDLKLENVFMQRSHDDEEDTAKVLDFGIAKVRSVDGNTLSNSTKTGAVLGTPYYMSPEQARGMRDIDHRTDLWSLGVIAFKCVTGVLPFDGNSLGDLLVKICTAPLPVPSHVLPGLPPAFDAWFARALDREASQRFSTATELADALAFAAGLSVRRGPGSNPQPIPTGTQRSAVMGPSSGANPGASPSAPAFGATSAPLTATSPGTSRSGKGAVVGVALAMVLLGGGTAVYVLGNKSKNNNNAGKVVATPSTPPAPSPINEPAPTPPSIASIEALPPPPATTTTPPAPAKQAGKTPRTKTAPPPAKPPEKTEAKLEPKVEPAKTEPPKKQRVGEPGF